MEDKLKLNVFVADPDDETDVRKFTYNLKNENIIRQAWEIFNFYRNDCLVYRLRIYYGK